MTLNLLGFKPNDNEADSEHEGDKGKGMRQPASDVHQDVAVQVERLRDQVDEPKNLQKSFPKRIEHYHQC